MTDREKIMYAVIGQLSNTDIPLIFKGGLITKLILQENDYKAVKRYTKDIDANWIALPPKMEDLVTAIQESIDKISFEYNVKITREYGVNRSAGIAIVSKSSNKTVFTMDIDMKPFLGSKLYGAGNIIIKGVLADEIIADKLYVTSTDKIYKYRAKDLIDLFALAHCCEINTRVVVGLIIKKGNHIKSFDGLINHKTELEHAYNSLTGIESKPSYEEIYHYLTRFIKPFIGQDLPNMIWNPNKAAWENPYYIEITHLDAERLASVGIKVHGNLSNKDRNVVAINANHRAKADSILSQSRNNKKYKK